MRTTSTSSSILSGSILDEESGLGDIDGDLPDEADEDEATLEMNRVSNSVNHTVVRILVRYS